jgi:hypothetical protein
MSRCIRMSMNLKKSKRLTPLSKKECHSRCIRMSMNLEKSKRLTPSVPKKNVILEILGQIIKEVK